jgi:DNA-binding beta-propeller fold protein YncE
MKPRFAVFRRPLTQSVRLILLCSLLWLSGCAGKTGTAGQPFFPPPPNLPRLQYLMGIANSTDVEGKDTSFSLFGGLTEQREKVRFIVKPYGIAEAGGKLYVSDVGTAQIIVIDLPGKKFELLKGAAGPGKLTTPANVALDRDGFIYVADAGRREVVVFTPDGDFLRAMGGDRDMKPVDVAIYGDRAYVLDIKNSDIKVFDIKSGTYLESFGSTGGPFERLAMPINLTMDTKGFLYATNGVSGRVLKFDRDGNLLLSFGQMGDGFGQFARPKGIAVDPAGLIHVVDGGHQNIQIFSETGRLLLFYGDAGKASPASLNLPAGIAYSTANLEYFQKMADSSFKLDGVVFVTNQGGKANKVAIYGYGKREGIDYEKEYEKIRKDLEERARKAREKEAQEGKKTDQPGTKAAEPAAK